MNRLSHTGVWVTHSLLLLLLILQAAPYFAQSQADFSQFSRRLATFSINLYSKLSAQKPNQNIIFSPFSIQSCAAMALLGAVGETANEMETGLRLSKNKTQIAESFYNISAEYEKSNVLRSTNKMYIKRGLELNNEFISLILKYFFSVVEPINFDQNLEAADQINSWVEQRTNSAIKNLLSPSTLNKDTRMVLISAIQFMGNWVYQFPESSTKTEAFYLNDTDSVKVPMMNLNKHFKYAKLQNMDATALELPYKDSDLSMLIVLPNSKSGIVKLEMSLRRIPLATIAQNLSYTNVRVKLPRFKSEFELELTKAFKEMGMKTMFYQNATFNNIIKSNETLRVSTIIHKAVLEVNEKGAEANEASVLPLQAQERTFSDEFYADHPFNYYIVKNQNMVLFAGKLMNPTK